MWRLACSSPEERPGVGAPRAAAGLAGGTHSGQRRTRCVGPLTACPGPRLATGLCRQAPRGPRGTARLGCTAPDLWSLVESLLATVATWRRCEARSNAALCFVWTRRRDRLRLAENGALPRVAEQSGPRQRGVIECKVQQNSIAWKGRGRGGSSKWLDRAGSQWAARRGAAGPCRRPFAPGMNPGRCPQPQRGNPRGGRPPPLLSRRRERVSVGARATPTRPRVHATRRALGWGVREETVTNAPRPTESRGVGWGASRQLGFQDPNARRTGSVAPSPPSAATCMPRASPQQASAAAAGAERPRHSGGVTGLIPAGGHTAQPPPPDPPAAFAPSILRVRSDDHPRPSAGPFRRPQSYMNKWAAVCTDTQCNTSAMGLHEEEAAGSRQGAQVGPPFTWLIGFQEARRTAVQPGHAPIAPFHPCAAGSRPAAAAAAAAAAAVCGEPPARGAVAVSDPDAGQRGNRV